MPLRVDWVTDRAGLGELAGAWTDLAGSESVPFLQPAWVLPWWDAFGQGKPLRVCTVWDGGELRALLPLYESRRALRALANVHSPTFRPLAVDGTALHALARAVLACRLEVVLPGLPLGDPTFSAFAPRRRLALSGPGYVSPAVELHDDYATYRTRVRSSLRSRLERLRRKMHREHAAEQVLVEAPADLERELQEGFAVEASGWKGQTGTAIVAQPETRRFYEEVSRALAERDQLRVNAIRLDGRLVAWDLCVLFAGRLHLLKTGYDESLSRLAPGLVLRLSVIERCYELGLASHELGGSDEAWKVEFANAERRHRMLRSYPLRPRGVLQLGADGAVEAARWAYRRVRPRT